VLDLCTILRGDFYASFYLYPLDRGLLGLNHSSQNVSKVGVPPSFFYVVKWLKSVGSCEELYLCEDSELRCKIGRDRSSDSHCRRSGVTCASEGGCEAKSLQIRTELRAVLASLRPRRLLQRHFSHVH
jgi:hypothetical protein